MPKKFPLDRLAERLHYTEMLGSKIHRSPRWLVRESAGDGGGETRWAPTTTAPLYRIVRDVLGERLTEGEIKVLLEEFQARCIEGGRQAWGR
jgi:hypothetical protein